MFAEIIISTVLLIILINIIMWVIKLEPIKSYLDTIDFWEKLISVGVIATLLSLILSGANSIVIARQEWQARQQGKQSMFSWVPVIVERSGDKQ